MNGTKQRYGETIWLWTVRVGGLGIAIHEVARQGAERPSLLVLAGGMIMFKTVYDEARNALAQQVAQASQPPPPQDPTQGGQP